MNHSPALPARDDYPELLLIGELLRDPSSLAHVPADLMPDDFCNREYGEIYQAARLIEAHGEIPTIVRIAALLPTDGSQRWAVETMAATASQAVRGHATFHGMQIIDQSRRQRLALLGIEVQRMACEGAKPDDLQHFIEAKLGQSHGSALAGRLAFEVGQAYVADLRSAEPPANIWTGLATLDDQFGGWGPGELVAIGAPSGGGKSAFALQVALHNADKGRPVIFFSCEMRDRELIQRILCGAAKVDSRRIRAGYRDQNEIDRIDAANERTLQDRPLVVAESSGRKIEEICAAAKYEAAKRGGLGLVVVDYLQIIAATNPRDDKRLQIAHITATLKRLAQSLDCCVLALSQLNREGADGGAKGKGIRLSNFAESAYIERDSDICGVIELAPECALTATFAYLKFRAGECGSVQIGWSGRGTRFHDIEPERHEAFDAFNQRRAAE